MHLCHSHSCPQVPGAVGVTRHLLGVRSFFCLNLQFVSISSLPVWFLFCNLVSATIGAFLILVARTGVMIKHKFQKGSRVPFSKCQSKGMAFKLGFLKVRAGRGLSSCHPPSVSLYRHPSNARLRGANNLPKVTQPVRRRIQTRGQGLLTS